MPHEEEAQACRDTPHARAAPTVYVVDDSDVVRDALSLLLQSVALNVRTFPNAERFLDAYDPDLPGCLILEVRLRRISGLALLEQLSAREFAIPVIILTAYAEVPTAVRAMHAGAVDFIEKPFRDQDLLDTVQRALDRDLEARSERTERMKITPLFASLTPRELEVLDLVVEGLASKEIAARLGVSVKTIEAHRSGIMRKLHVRCVAELVRLALRFGTWAGLHGPSWTLRLGLADGLH